LQAKGNPLMGGHKSSRGGSKKRDKELRKRGFGEISWVGGLQPG